MPFRWLELMGWRELAQAVLDEVQHDLVFALVGELQPEWKVEESDGVILYLTCRIGSWHASQAMTAEVTAWLSPEGWQMIQQWFILKYLDWITEEQQVEDWAPRVGTEPIGSYQYSSRRGHQDHVHIDVSTMEDRYRRSMTRTFGIPYDRREEEPVVDPSEIPDVTDQDRARWSRALDTTPDEFEESSPGMTTEELMEAIGKTTAEWDEMKEEMK